jgi:hypothetical protein
MRLMPGLTWIRVALRTIAAMIASTALVSAAILWWPVYLAPPFFAYTPHAYFVLLLLPPALVFARSAMSYPRGMIVPGLPAIVLALLVVLTLLGPGLAQRSTYSTIACSTTTWHGLLTQSECICAWGGVSDNGQRACSTISLPFSPIVWLNDGR